MARKRKKPTRLNDQALARHLQKNATAVHRQFYETIFLAGPLWSERGADNEIWTAQKQSFINYYTNTYLAYLNGQEIETLQECRPPIAPEHLAMFDACRYAADDFKQHQVEGIEATKKARPQCRRVWSS